MSDKRNYDAGYVDVPKIDVPKLSAALLYQPYLTKAIGSFT